MAFSADLASESAWAFSEASALRVCSSSLLMETSSWTASLFLAEMVSR